MIERVGYFSHGVDELDPDRYSHFDNRRMGQACSRCEELVYKDDDEAVCADCENELKDEEKI